MESEQPRGSEKRDSQEIDKHLCPANVPLAEKDSGCRCGSERLEKKHFRTLTLIQAKARFVVGCKDSNMLVITDPTLLKRKE